jgi:transcription elongation factor Elf1
MSQFNFSCKHCRDLISIELKSNHSILEVECQLCNYRYSDGEIEELLDNININEFGAELDKVGEISNVYD